MTRKLLIPSFLAAMLACVSSAFAQTGEIDALVVNEQGKPVSDAVVIATPVDGSVRFPPRAATGIIDQIDKQFVPKVKAVLVGTAVNFPNHDNVRHHVYSFSPAKRFELPLYTGVPAQPVVFDKPGVVVLGCNIHDWMVGFVYVSASPYFGTTGGDGKVAITDLSPRAYVLRVWHPQSEASEEATAQTIEVRAGHNEVRWTLKLKPEVRVRRAPVPDRNRY